eukprot:882442-Pelagomonas_calceolata.AAC.4
MAPTLPLSIGQRAHHKLQVPRLSIHQRLALLEKGDGLRARRGIGHGCVHGNQGTVTLVGREGWQKSTGRRRTQAVNHATAALSWMQAWTLHTSLTCSLNGIFDMHLRRLQT